MSAIDWTIMVVAVISLRLISLSSSRYMRGVTDFLAANRCAGRYLLTIASQMGGTGAITIVAAFQMYFSSGLPPIYWGFMSLLAGTVVTVTGYVVYRYRETRALTLAQFFEMRYGHNFRVFAGMVLFVSGVLNFGIFPAVTSRFFIYFCGIPDHFQMLGATIPMMVPIMLIDMGLALTFVTMGGQISVMVTECVQGMVSAFAFIVIAVAVLLKVHWGSMVQAMATAAPVNNSMLHPFHTSGSNYGALYFIVGVLSTFYGQCAWQGTASFMTSGRTPHEQKMGQIIALWRQLPQTAMCIILPLAAFAIMKLNLPEFAAISKMSLASINNIANEQIRSEMTTPIILAHLLPIGIKGLFCTVMLFFSFTCYDSYLHSWGSIFVQDVLMPIRRRALDPARHVKWLRWSIIGVALFGFVFSLCYPPKEDIYYFFALTGTIWLGGAGAAIVGGLYSKRGTTAAAYCAIILGVVVGVGGIVLNQVYTTRTGHQFPINDQSRFGLTMLTSSLIYVIVSLLSHSRWKQRLTASILGTAVITAAIAGIAITKAALLSKFYLWTLLMHSGSIVSSTLISFFVLCLFTLVCVVVSRDGEHEFNLDRMLHRGQYGDKTSEELAREARVSPWQKALGITGEFSTGDKFLAGMILVWNLGWFSCFAVMAILNVTMPGRFGTMWWAGFWHFYLMLTLTLSVPVVIWFTIGGVSDLKALFHVLTNAVRDASDDGTVRQGGEGVPHPALHADASPKDAK